MAANNLIVRQSKTNPGAVLFPRDLRRAVCVEYLRDFNLERVAEMFGTTAMTIRRLVNSDTMQEHLSSRLGDTSQLDRFAARRLLEALLQEALDPDASPARTEARKMLARHYLPKRTESKSEHRYFIEVPEKLSPGQWAERFSGQSPPRLDVIDPDVIEAEIIEDDADG